MKRIIKTYETCSDELLTQLAEKFPDGIKPRHLEKFTTIKGDIIQVVEFATDDCVYLIKFSPKLEEAIDNVDLDLDEDDDDDIDMGEDGLDANLAIDEEAEAIPDDMGDEEDED